MPCARLAIEAMGILGSLPVSVQPRAECSGQCYDALHLSHKPIKLSPYWEHIIYRGCKIDSFELLHNSKYTTALTTGRS